jgi:hypothetical protein
MAICRFSDNLKQNLNFGVGERPTDILYIPTYIYIYIYIYTPPYIVMKCPNTVQIVVCSISVPTARTVSVRHITARQQEDRAHLL